jgi:Polyketide cyclase / dehydrase and lipid transport
VKMGRAQEAATHSVLLTGGVQRRRVREDRRVTAHVVVSQDMPASAGAVFDLVHDYGRRLSWDTLLRAAWTEGNEPPAKGVVAVCTARRALGGYSFRTRYVTFERPRLAAVTLESRPPFFASWAASIRHQDRPGGRSTVTYTMTFRCRPAWAAPVVEPVARFAFARETRRRLRALAAAVGRPSRL